MLAMLSSSDDAPIGYVEDEGFFFVSWHGGGHVRSRTGRGSGRECQLCYFVVFGPQFSQTEHGGAIMA